MEYKARACLLSGGISVGAVRGFDTDLRLLVVQAAIRRALVVLCDSDRHR